MAKNKEFKPTGTEEYPPYPTDYKDLFKPHDEKMNTKQRPTQATSFAPKILLPGTPEFNQSRFYAMRTPGKGNASGTVATTWASVTSKRIFVVPGSQDTSNTKSTAQTAADAAPATGNTRVKYTSITNGMSLSRSADMKIVTNHYLHNTPLEEFAGRPEVKALLNLDQQRELALRARQAGIEDFREGNYIACVAQIVGTPASKPCDRCARGCGPFTECVVVLSTYESSNNKQRNYLNGCCANCHYGDNDRMCNHNNKHKDNDNLATTRGSMKRRDGGGDSATGKKSNKRTGDGGEGGARKKQRLDQPGNSANKGIE